MARIKDTWPDLVWVLVIVTLIIIFVFSPVACLCAGLIIAFLVFCWPLVVTVVLTALAAYGIVHLAIYFIT